MLTFMYIEYTTVIFMYKTNQRICLNKLSIMNLISENQNWFVNYTGKKRLLESNHNNFPIKHFDCYISSVYCKQANILLQIKSICIWVFKSIQKSKLTNFQINYFTESTIDQSSFMKSASLTTCYFDRSKLFWSTRRLLW